MLGTNGLLPIRRNVRNTDSKALELAFDSLPSVELCGYRFYLRSMALNKMDRLAAEGAVRRPRAEDEPMATAIKAQVEVGAESGDSEIEEGEASIDVSEYAAAWEAAATEHSTSRRPAATAASERRAARKENRKMAKAACN